MKRQRYDYSGFSMRRLREPRFSHLLLLAGWLVYFALYVITENLIPASKCHEIHCVLDDIIPFREEFVLIYVAWFVYVAGALAYSIFYNVEGFRKMQIFFMITQGVAMACYIIYPSIQLLRPAVFPRQNFFTWILGLIYAFDTPTGVCPSLHVAYSAAIASMFLKDRTLSKGWKAAAAVFAILVCPAVCFVKQHSALDVLWALPLSLLAEMIVYGKDYWWPRITGKAQKD